MEFEFWWLLVLPLLFGLGWLAARQEYKGAAARQGELPASYFKGVNFLLKEQPDKAIDAFLEIAEIDTNTVELHFALANLFRKRGEIDRAIRVHQFLNSREQIASADRARATFELGVDFLRAGILDRAEEAFRSLEKTSMQIDAARQLLELYELEKDWSKAIDQSAILGRLGAQIPQADIAHFYCELAELSRKRKQFDDALHSLSKALEIEPQSVRASLMLGEIAYEKGNFDEAINCWKRAETQNPWYIPLIGQRMWEAYREMGNPTEGISLLEAYCSKYPSIDLLFVLTQATEEVNGSELALERLRGEVQKRPSLLGLDQLLQRQLQALQDGEGAEDLTLIRDLIAKHTQRLVRYRCQTCGFQAKQFHWQCPGCATWDSIVPRRSEELDFYPISAKSK